MSDPISCPKCDCTGTASIIIDHFYIDHSEYILNYESTIAMDLNKSSYEHYLYIDESRDVVSLALATYDIIDDDFKVFTFDGQILSKKTNAVTQKVELYTVSNKLQWSSDDITCAKWPTDENKQIIEVNIKDHDYSHNLMLCKVFLTHLREENLQPAEVPFLSETKNEPSLLKSNIPYCSKNNLELFDNSGNISEGPLSSFDLSPDYPRYSILTCSKCGCECTSVEELADHLLSNSCTKNVAPAKETTTDLKCKKCALICKSLAGLASHSRSHNKVASVKEPIKTAVSARNEPSSDIHKCGTLCKSGAGLASHLRAHDRAKNTAKQAPAKESNTSVKGDRKCTKCGLVCKSLAGLASHNREHDKKESTKAPAPVINEPSDNMLKCSQCGTLCKSGAGLSSHLRAHDRANNAPKQTPAKESYTKEQAKSTPPATNEPRGDIHKCGQCEMLCKSVAGLASHMRAHERAAQNGPSVKDSLLSQMKAPVTNNVFGISSSKSCSICGIVCQSGAGLASHMRAHERRTTSSNFDGFTPDYGSSVDRMLSLISMSGSGGGGYSSGGGGYSSGGGGGGYSCGECGRVCASGAGLASHMRAHARRSGRSTRRRRRRCSCPNR